MWDYFGRNDAGDYLSDEGDWSLAHCVGVADVAFHDLFEVVVCRTVFEDVLFDLDCAGHDGTSDGVLDLFDGWVHVFGGEHRGTVGSVAHGWSCVRVGLWK